MSIYAKISSKILKVVMQPGRLVFPKGSAKSVKTLDSFSLEYLLIVQEQARVELTSVPSKYRRNPLLSILLFPIFILRGFFLIFRLFIVNQIVSSYLNSHQLKELLLKKYENINS